MNWLDIESICGKYNIFTGFVLEDKGARKIMRDSYYNAKTEKERNFYIKKLENYINENF